MFSRPRKKYFTLSEALAAIVDEDDENAEVVLLPPSHVDPLTDEEDVDDEVLGHQKMTDMPGEVEIHQSSSDEEAEVANPPKKVKKERKIWPKWKKNENLSPFPGPEESILTPNFEEMDIRNKSAAELFFTFFSEEIVENILVESNRYAASKNVQFHLDRETFSKFLGIVFLSGYHSLPRQRMYWLKESDCNVSIVQNCMSRKRFEDIKRFLHVADNNEMDRKDRMAKLRPLIQGLNTSLQQFGVFKNFLSIDEQMVPYYGNHGAKMFIKGKPIRFGFKLWCLCSSDGFPFKI